MANDDQNPKKSAPKRKAITSLDELPEYRNQPQQKSPEVQALEDALGDHNQQVRDLEDALDGRTRGPVLGPVFDLRSTKKKKAKSVEGKEPWLRAHKFQFAMLIIGLISLGIVIYVNFLKPSSPTPQSPPQTQPTVPHIEPADPSHPIPKKPEIWNKPEDWHKRNGSQTDSNPSSNGK